MAQLERKPPSVLEWEQRQPSPLLHGRHDRSQGGNHGAAHHDMLRCSQADAVAEGAAPHEWPLCTASPPLRTSGGPKDPKGQSEEQKAPFRAHKLWA